VSAESPSNHAHVIPEVTVTSQSDEPEASAPVGSPEARAWLAAREGGSKTARLARSLLARG